MEFNTNFNKNLASHSSFSLENPCRTPNGKEISTISNGPYQNVPSFGNFSSSETLSNPSLGNESQFYDSFYKSESQSGNKSLMHLGSVGSNGVVHSEILNYSQRILSQDSNSLPFNNESYTGSGNPINENLGLSNQGLNKSVSYQKAKPRTKGKKESGNSTLKGLWTPEEDRHLIELVHEFGEKRWTLIAMKLKDRVGKQCRERWLNHLMPGIKKDRITEEEEMVIVAGLQQHGSKWAMIAKRLPGRSENAVKNHYNATKRRLKNRHAPKTYLEKYIMSMSSESSNQDFSESPDVVCAISSLEDLEQVTPNDGAGLTCSFTQMLDASYNLEHNDQMGSFTQMVDASYHLEHNNQMGSFTQMLDASYNLEHNDQMGSFTQMVDASYHLEHNNQMASFTQMLDASYNLEHNDQMGSFTQMLDASYNFEHNNQMGYFTHMLDAGYNLQHNDQMLPTDATAMVSPDFPKEAGVSGNFVDEDSSVKDYNNAPNFGMGVVFNVEDDDQFLQASTGWK